MIDPHAITNFHRTFAQQEELLLFAIVVAGKRSDVQVKKLDEFLTDLRANHGVYKHDGPFALITRAGRGGVRAALERCRMGQYTRVTNAFMAVSGLDIQYTGLIELESRVGPKTARFFLLHSRPGQNLAVLDTHVLAWLRELGYDTPKSTPRGKRYETLEALFLHECKQRGKTPATLDLAIWSSRAKGKRTA